MPILVLARNRGQRTARERVGEVLSGVKAAAIGGDISAESDIGASESDLRTLRAYDLDVWHAAANTSFDKDSRADIVRTNVGGTQKLLGFLDTLSVRRFHYISTAYVAGDRARLSSGRGCIAYEDEDFVGQCFRNAYEESKCHAERMIKEWAATTGNPATIYRLAIALGHSRSGWTSAFTGYYGYMRGFSVLRTRLARPRTADSVNQSPHVNGYMHLPVRVWGDPEATINVACVDYLVDVIGRLSQLDRSIGKTFHVVNPAPPRFAWLLMAGLRVIGIGGVRVCKPLDSSAETKLERLVNNSLAPYRPYTMGEPVFDTANVRAVLGTVPAHPPVDEALVRRLLSYAIREKFGRPVHMSSHTPR